jgi:hypothetical protein
MKNINFKSLLPIVAAILIFIVITFGYLTPLLKGKAITQSDMTLHTGMSKEIEDHRAKYNEEPLWTNSMFCGMPAYQISMHYNSNLTIPLMHAFMLWLPAPANMIFTYMLGFLILLLVLKVDKWLSIVGSIAFGLSAGYLIIIAAGHNTQAFAIGFMAPVFAGVILTCRGKYLLGGALTALFFSLELLCNHFQITYYLILFLMVYVIFEIVARVKEKQFQNILKMIGVLLIAGVLALGCNFSNLWNTYDYAKYTIRGPSELTSDKSNKTTGLDKDYVTQWSMGTSETMTLMIPGFKGLSASIPMAENKSALKNVDPQIKENIGKAPQYWGDQPFTDSPYSSAIIIFLFVLGLIIVEGRIKWALLTITILSILLSWGKNFMPLTNLFLDHFPGYNKFRAPSMILMMAEFAIPVLAMLAIDKLIKTPGIFKQNIKLAFIKKEISVEKAFYIAFGLTGGLALIYFIAPTALLDFFSAAENKQIDESAGKDISMYVDNMELARVAIFKSFALRSFFFITLGAGMVWLYLKSKVSKGLLILVLAVLVLFDLALVDKNFLNDKNFTTKQEVKNPYPETTADKAILEDTDPDFRVLNIAESTFNETHTSYYHKSLGGYHAAKLRRYQDLIDAHIQSGIKSIAATLNAAPTDSSIRATFAKQGVLNMLNMRYVIYNPDAAPLQNRYALGNAWFVHDVKFVKNADEEIKTIGEVNPAYTIVVDERYKNELDAFTPKADATATIKLTVYRANDLKYESNTTSEQLAVFSEIYYKEGWNAYIDGELKPHFGSDYVLRAMRIPAGKHNIEFKFEPKMFFVGEKISMTSSLLLFGFIGGALFMAFKRKEL